MYLLSTIDIFHFTDHSDVHQIQDDQLLVCYISACTVWFNCWYSTQIRTMTAFPALFENKAEFLFYFETMFSSPKLL